MYIFVYVYVCVCEIQSLRMRNNPNNCIRCLLVAVFALRHIKLHTVPGKTIALVKM